MTKALRVVIVLFSIVGLYFLLRRLDFAYQAIPLSDSGNEGRLIEVAIDTLFGMGASFVAVILGFIHLPHCSSKKGASTKSAEGLLAWCSSLLLGFAGFFCIVSEKSVLDATN